MPEKKEVTTATGKLLYNSLYNYLELDGYELQNGDSIEVRILGSWIPGQVAVDPGGWFLFTTDHVGIRLQSGLPGRFIKQNFDWFATQAHQPAILIVDDDPALLEALPQTIKLRIPKGHISVAASARSALQMMHERRFDVIVCDIKMPDMDGLALLENVQTQLPGIPVLLITGHGDHDMAIRALRGGAFDYILKPINRDEFIAALQRALQVSLLRQQVAAQQHSLETHTQVLEQEVRQRTRELEEANAIKDKLVGLASREMKAPLGRLKEMVQRLQQKLMPVEPAEVVREDLQEINMTVERLDEVVQELLRTSRIESRVFIARRRRCDIVELCNELLEQLRGSQLQLECNFVKSSVEAEIDVEQVRQVFALLFPSLLTTIQETSSLTITLQRSGNEIIIAIRDLQNSIGQSISLYAARKIMERHAGRLDLQDFPNQHSTIYLLLPFTQPGNGETKGSKSEPPRACAMWTLRAKPSHLGKTPSVS